MTNVVAKFNAAYPWSIGTKCPALLTVFNYKNPAYLVYPDILPPVFHTENNVSLKISKYLPKLMRLSKV